VEIGEYTLYIIITLREISASLKTERDHSVMALSIFACSVYSQAHAVPQRTADQKIKIFEKISPQNSIFSDTTA